MMIFKYLLKALLFLLPCIALAQVSADLEDLESAISEYRFTPGKMTERYFGRVLESHCVDYGCKSIFFTLDGERISINFKPSHFVFDLTDFGDEEIESDITTPIGLFRDEMTPPSGVYWQTKDCGEFMKTNYQEGGAGNVVGTVMIPVCGLAAIADTAFGITMGLVSTIYTPIWVGREIFEEKDERAKLVKEGLKKANKVSEILDVLSDGRKSYKRSKFDRTIKHIVQFSEYTERRMENSPN